MANLFLSINKKNTQMNTDFLNAENIQLINSHLIEYAPKVLMAIIVLIIGFWIIKKIVKGLELVMGKSKIDVSLIKFLGSITNVFLKLMLLFSVAGMIGINTASFIAIFGALMVGVGMSLNGTIGHFASGVLLMILKPFKVGDLVTIGDGKTGVIEVIKVFNTTLKTLDNKRIFIANSNVLSNTITNITGQGITGIELIFGISYDANIDTARKIILKVGSECPWVLKDPEQKVVVAELADSSVNLATRPFCKSEDYWNTMFYIRENVKKQFDANNIPIPFPQMDIHMKEN